MDCRPKNFQQRNIQYLTQEELIAFFKVIKRLRDITLFNMIYKYGLRIGEASRLLVTDLSLKQGTVRIHRLKGSTSSEYPLHHDTRKLLTKYIDSLPPEQEHLFHSIRKKQISTRQIYDLYRKYYDLAGLTNQHKRHPHCLRHSIAIHALETGSSILYVQWLLGHRKMDSTLYYTTLTDRLKMAEFAEMNRSQFIVNL